MQRLFELLHRFLELLPGAFQLGPNGLGLANVDLVHLLHCRFAPLFGLFAQLLHLCPGRLELLLACLRQVLAHLLHLLAQAVDLLLARAVGLVDDLGQVRPQLLLDLLALRLQLFDLLLPFLALRRQLRPQAFDLLLALRLQLFALRLELRSQALDLLLALRLQLFPLRCHLLLHLLAQLLALLAKLFDLRLPLLPLFDQPLPLLLAFLLDLFAQPIALLLQFAAHRSQTAVDLTARGRCELLAELRQFGQRLLQFLLGDAHPMLDGGDDLGQPFDDGWRYGDGFLTADERNGGAEHGRRPGQRRTHRDSCWLTKGATFRGTPGEGRCRHWTSTTDIRVRGELPDPRPPRGANHPLGPAICETVEVAIAPPARDRDRILTTFWLRPRWRPNR
ncbi:MAG: hypothetical protein IPK26_30330 [Planctomycetes bacterium]|nr:hypothetical protein [Planctomycetota bacterium]